MPDSFEISLGSAGTISIEIERSRRLKKMTLRVLPKGQVVVALPERARGDFVKKAKAFAEENAPWIKRALEKIKRQVVPEQKTLFSYLRERPSISADGKSYAIEFGRASIEPFFVFRTTSPITILCLRDGNEDADLKELLRKLAATVIPPRVRILAERARVSVGQISIRAQRSRWGSCTSNGNLSLNWRLILLPPELQDHVILHELAHRVHMDHSGEFWDLLNSWDARTGTHDRALTKNWAPQIFTLIQDEE